MFHGQNWPAMMAMGSTTRRPPGWRAARRFRRLASGSSTTRRAWPPSSSRLWRRRCSWPPPLSAPSTRWLRPSSGGRDRGASTPSTPPPVRPEECDSLNTHTPFPSTWNRFLFSHPTVSLLKRKPSWLRGASSNSHRKGKHLGEKMCLSNLVSVEKRWNDSLIWQWKCWLPKKSNQ